MVKIKSQYLRQTIKIVLYRLLKPLFSIGAQTEGPVPLT